MAHFFIADLHLSHENILRFGRDEFRDINDHDQWLIGRINKRVTDKDKLFILGDVAFASRQDLLGELNGIKTVVLGNHDYPQTVDTIRKYAKVAGSVEYKKCILTHIPVHPSQLERRYRLNIHGHLHGNTLDDKRYFNCSVEQCGGVPYSWEEIQND